ncbi:transposase [Anaeromyxobacter sp. SG64]|uniref:transposase n=1 Tax=Anaeromyxobacter sp. SG64 TaxID=2925409 RepID=UPI0027E0DA5E|nr:transposase [Anaeromyxobacter sp. SG64]
MPGAWHHVMHRGARREPIFRRDDHCLLFLQSLEEAVEHHGLEVHGYSLMPNHYHLLVRTPLGNLSRCMRHVNATYTQRVNLRHGWDGPIFRGRFRSQIVDDDSYLEHVFAYIHLNPFHAGLATRIDDPCWTSLRAYLGNERAPAWLRTEVFTERFEGRAAIGEAIRARRKRRDQWPEGLDREAGWIRTAERTERLRQVGAARRASTTAVSIGEVLKQVAQVAGCTVADVKEREMGPGANPARRLAVWALSRAQVFSHRDIAAALGMSQGNVAKVLSRLRQERPPAPLAEWMETLVARLVGSGRS